MATELASLPFDEDQTELHLEQFLTYKLNVLSNMINRQTERFLADNFAISLPEWRVLANLGRFADLSVRDVASLSEMDKALVSRAVAKLVKRGFVNSQPHANDGRLVVLSLTTAGLEQYNQILPKARKRQERLYCVLDLQEREAIDSILQKLTRFLQTDQWDVDKEGA